MNNRKKNQGLILGLTAVLIICIVAFLGILVVLFLVDHKKTDLYQDKISMGDKYLEELNYDDAILAYADAINIKPKLEQAYVSLATVYINAGDYDNAQSVLDYAHENISKEKNLKKVEELESEIGQNQQEISDEVETAQADAGTPLGIAENVLQIAYIGNQTMERSFVKAGEYEYYTSLIEQGGVLCAKQYDFDQDGKDEIFVLTLEYDDSVELGNQENAPNYLMMHMLELVDTSGKWFESASSEALRKSEKNGKIINTNNEMKFDTFLKDTGDTVIIGFELNELSNYFSDGEFWAVEEYQYKSGGFLKLTADDSYTIAGSDIEDYMKLGNAGYNHSWQSVNDFVEEVEELGFDITELGFDEPIMEQDTSLIQISRILTESNLTYSVVNDWKESSSELLEGPSTQYIDYTS